MIKKNIKVVIGLILMVLSAFWIYQMTTFYYQYHFTNIAFVFEYPTWLIATNIALGLLVTYHGFQLTYNKTSLKKSILTVGFICMTGILINNFYYLI